MSFNPDNHIVQLCAKGIQLEGEGKPAEASQAFQQAWNEASNDLEKFIAAHYVARHQQTIEAKLEWDRRALEHALKSADETMKAHYPSLYLNIAKCYEDLNDAENALIYYQMALFFVKSLPAGGYGTMIKSGILKGMERIKL
jgi:rifampin ADP-ribosylating transferase